MQGVQALQEVQDVQAPQVVCALVQACGPGSADSATVKQCRKLGLCKHFRWCNRCKQCIRWRQYTITGRYAGHADLEKAGKAQAPQIIFSDRSDVGSEDGKCQSYSAGSDGNTGSLSGANWAGSTYTYGTGDAGIADRVHYKQCRHSGSNSSKGSLCWPVTDSANSEWQRNCADSGIS
jgi:hypothetical protein